MRNIVIALVFSLSLSSCASSNDVGNHDVSGALLIAAILGGAMAVAAH